MSEPITFPRYPAPATQRGYRLIVFDWDGTVLDSVPTLVACFRASFADVGVPEPDPSLLRRVAGMGWHLAVGALVPDVEPELRERLRAAYRRAVGQATRPQLLPGARALIEELHQRGYLLAIATARATANVERSCEAWGLRAHFHSVRGADDTRRKPNPAMLFSLLEELDVAPEQALMVGDTPIDIQMAHNAGVDVAGVRSGGLTATELAQLGATHVLDDLTRLLELLPNRPGTPARRFPGLPMDWLLTEIASGPLTLRDRAGDSWTAWRQADRASTLWQYAGFKAYAALGVPVPEVRLIHEMQVPQWQRRPPDAGSECVLFVAHTPDRLDARTAYWSGSNDRQARIRDELGRGFVVDCLLGNRALFDDPLSCFSVDIDDRVQRTRVDCHSSLAVEDANISIIDDARDPDIYPTAAELFAQVSKRELIEQISAVETRVPQLATHGLPPELAVEFRACLDRRLANLIAHRSRLQSEHAAMLARTATALADARAVVVFDKQFENRGLSLAGVSFTTIVEPAVHLGDFDEPEFVLEPGLRAAAGIVVIEPDERVWIYEPRGHWGGHQHAFPKGRVDEQHVSKTALHRTAVRETLEEVGIHATITGFLADFSFFGHQTRYYLGRRIGGDPCQAHWEADSIKLVPMAELHRFVNVENDRAVLRALLASCGRRSFVPAVRSVVARPRAHRWRGPQGRCTATAAPHSSTARGRWFEDEHGDVWLMKTDGDHTGLRTSAEVVAARIYDFFGYWVHETHKLVADELHLVLCKHEGEHRDITDFIGLDDVQIRRMRLVAAYISDWGRQHNAAENVVLDDGSLVLTGFAGSLGCRGASGSYKPGPCLGESVGYFPATRDFSYLWQEFTVADAEHPWQRLCSEDLPAMIERFRALDDHTIDDIVAAARYPNAHDAEHVARALKWRRNAIICGAVPYFQHFTRAHPLRQRRQLVDDRTLALPPSLGEIADVLIEDPRSIAFEQREGLCFRSRAGSLRIDELLRHIERRTSTTTHHEQIAVGEAALTRHLEAFFCDDLEARYLINVADLYATQGKGNCSDNGVAGDVMSLRQYTSFLFYPMNALFRLDLADPEQRQSLRTFYQVAARNFFRIRGVTMDTIVGRNMLRLFEFAASITGPDDPRLCRLVREQLLHNIMACKALLRQAPPEVGAHPRLYRITDLDTAALDVYRRALAAPAGCLDNVIVESAFTSTSEAEDTSDRHSRRDKAYKFVITPLPKDTRARALDGAIDNVVSLAEREILYPPGSAFAVRGIDSVSDDRTRTGESRTRIILQEVNLLDYTGR